MIEKLTLEATIPTVQYGNIKPTLELEGETFEEIRDLGLKRMKEISDMCAGEGFTFDVRGLSVSSGKTVTASQKVLKTLDSELTGVTLYFDEDKHAYYDAKGERYSSASSFPDKFYDPFDSQMIIDQMVKKYPELDRAALLAMWRLNSEASTGYGTAIHAALENFDKNRVMGDMIKGDNANKALSKNPFLKQVVEWFQETQPDNEDVLTEAFVANKQYKICGRIDRLKFVNREKRIVRVQDYKTDGNILDKKYQSKTSPFKTKIENTLVGYHRLQLSNLAFILTEAGYTVEGTDIFWLNPAKLIKGQNPWETFSSEVVDITEGLK